LRTQVEQGVAVEFEQQITSSGDDRRWIHAKVVPLTQLGPGLRAVVFAKDTTATNRALSDLRDATLRLTEVEDAQHRRLGRELHDGPIQLLAALMLRLDVLDDAEHTFALRETTSTVNSQLREALGEFSDDDRNRPAGSRLERWIAPFLTGSPVELHISDQCVTQPGGSMIQSAFVFVYELVRAARYIGRNRVVRVSLKDEFDGYRLILTITATEQSSIQRGRVAAQYRAMVAYGQSIGGTVSTTLADDGVRALDVWIPRDSEPGLVGRIDGVRKDHRLDRAREVNRISSLPPLPSAAWEELATEAPERLTEFDHKTAFSFVNQPRSDLYGYDTDELIGRKMNTVVDSTSMGELAPHLMRLRSGSIIDLEWSRKNAFGDLRRVRLRASPRINASGGWEGALVSEEDLSEVSFLEHLAESALADFTKTRRLVTQTSLLRLATPVAACEELIESIHEFEASTPDPEPFRAIRAELEAAVPRVQRSLDALTTTDPASVDFGQAVRTSVDFVLADTELAFVDDTSTAPSTEASEVLFRIAREAVMNALVHGKASLITMTLSNEREGHRLLIHDDGIGITTDDLDGRRGHLGTRSMMERAFERGGNCRIEPATDGGTLVSVWLPPQTRRDSMLDVDLHPEL
jgi:PAS domain S-box-containing protein